MSIGDLIRSMSAAGATPEAIAIAVDAIEAAQAAVADGRAKAAERKRRQRAKERGEDVTVTGQSRDMDVTVTDNTPFPAPSPLLPPNPQQPPAPTHTPVRDTPARKGGDFPKPEWADPQVWADFMLNRKRKRMTNSATAYRGFLRDIEKHTDANWPPGRLLEHAAAKGWASINAPEEQDTRHELSRRPARTAPQQSSRAARLFETMGAAEAERRNSGDHSPVGRSLPAIRWDQ